MLSLAGSGGEIQSPCMGLQPLALKNPLVPKFHPLGNHLYFEGFTQRNNGFDNGGILGLVMQMPYKALLKLIPSTGND